MCILQRSLIVGALLISTSLSAEIINSSSFEENNYTQVYGLNIDDSNLHSEVPYYINNSDSIADGSFKRIAYRMELQKYGSSLDWIWVSMDAFTDDANLIGVPSFAGSNTSFQQVLTSMNVFSNKAGIVTGTGISTGNIEFWPYNYGQEDILGIPNSSGVVYDTSDYNRNDYDYGSMQIHNYAEDQTLFALNRFSSASKDLGIGNQIGGSGHTDWTFATNSIEYSVKRLDVFVSMVDDEPLLIETSSVPLSSTITLLAASLIGLRKRRLK